MSLRGPLPRALLGLVALFLMGHSPYRQWAVYRDTHLVVVAEADLPGAFPVSEEVARCLAVRLPRSRAVAARARSAREVMRLLSTRQLPVGLVAAGDAADASLGRGAFAGEDPLPLRALAVVGPYLLVTLEDFPEALARDIAAALAEHPLVDISPSAAPSPIPLHPGALSAVQEGAAEPRNPGVPGH